jgi:hypothetical protein
MGKSYNSSNTNNTPHTTCTYLFALTFSKIFLEILITNPFLDSDRDHQLPSISKVLHFTNFQQHTSLCEHSMPKFNHHSSTNINQNSLTFTQTASTQQTNGMSCDKNNSIYIYNIIFSKNNNNKQCTIK